ncbi:ABC transporter ATP-binding protein [Alicyclobacillus cycloheptanicus]|uniref:Branched-chain amino acid transport system ATP-binding protein n=1 Tax=Alicyclobacillus cycloheptanicus TaxID=1457 RepID=A0ABT9XI12_9BACL|nr:ABC transporter ATP-binding protein [Alicyclobacillus cycloheptanicus]MDQ0189953.1 branched-chain amino acid transport system ATP-binding protein [Alicyclobacillus cycloheptanicus]WDM02151.1 ABC transporter ATP-binding protein [Alicyclobacillus cycloheptanicus]
MSENTQTHPAADGQQLVVEDLHAYYGRSHVLQGVSLKVGAGEVVALLGRNGAGKTTTFRALTGLMPRTTGSVTLGDRQIGRKSTHQIAQLGVVYVPSGRRSFPMMTVKENLLIAVENSFRRARRKQALDEAFAMFPALARRVNTNAGVLSGGENQMLKMACAFLLQPTILLLDEPTEGLAPIVVAELVEHVRTLADTGVGILLAEQNARFAFQLSARAYVLNKGIVQMSGRVSELAESEELTTHLGI